MDELVKDKGRLSRCDVGRLALATGVTSGAASLFDWSGTAAGADAASFQASRRRPDRLPNMVVIMADDLGWGDVGCFGAPDIRTPHIDRLARQGVRFTDAYAGSSVCSPTRFSLYTGRYPGRLRGGLAEPIGAPGPRMGLPPGFPTLASLLRGVGYSTAMVGKWHCGYLPWFSPLRSGWEEFFRIFSGGCDYFSHYSPVTTDGQGNSKVGNDLHEGETNVARLGYLTELLGRRAADYVRQQRERSYLLNVNFTAPHWPWEGPEDKAVSASVTAELKNGGGWAALAHHDGGSLSTYRGMVEAMDAAVGRVLRAIDDSGAGRDTAVLFLSDNGGERFSYMWPFSGAKLSLREGGLRIPCVLRWPAHIRAHQVSEIPVSTLDWMATLLDWGGARPDPDTPLDGANLSGYLLDGAPGPARDLFWRIRGQRALRRGEWKYYRGDAPQPAFASPATEFLHHLPTDPRERTNHAQAQPHILDELRSAWEDINATLLAYEP